MQPAIGERAFSTSGCCRNPEANGFGAKPLQTLDPGPGFVVGRQPAFGRQLVDHLR